jgi:hypothetical protein
MAGLGYKNFTVGQVLTSAEVDGYLMEQTVMKFADAAARTTALTGVLAEGMLSYLMDTNAVEKYDGSAWVAIAAGDIEGVTAGTGLTGGGTSGTVTLAIDSTVATLTGTQTFTNKALTAPTIKDAIIRGVEEDINIVASAATGTINFDVDTASVWYYTTNATANHTLNFRYSSGVSLNTAMATGDAITLVWLNTNGSTAYYPNVIQIDGSTVTPKVPAAITAGNASSIDAYSFTIIKTASATFTVLETQTKFA